MGKIKNWFSGLFNSSSDKTEEDSSNNSNSDSKNNDANINSENTSQTENNTNASENNTSEHSEKKKRLKIFLQIIKIKYMCFNLQLKYDNFNIL